MIATRGVLDPFQPATGCAVDMRELYNPYRGDRELVKMKGIPELFPYHEVLWEAHRFGIRSEAVTEAASTRPTPLSSVSPPRPADRSRAAEGKRIGTVKTWMPGKGFGFVTDASGEDFYFSRKSLVYPEDEKLLTQPNAQLAFRTAEPVSEERSRRAVTALVIGGEGEGRITYVSPNPDRRFGFITVTDDFGSEISVYMSVLEGQTWAAGDTKWPLRLRPRRKARGQSTSSASTISRKALRRQHPKRSEDPTTQLVVGVFAIRVVRPGTWPAESSGRKPGRSRITLRDLRSPMVKTGSPLN